MAKEIKIYVLYSVDDNTQDTDVLGVYSTEEKGTKARDEFLNSKYHCPGREEVYLTEFQVDARPMYWVK